MDKDFARKLISTIAEASTSSVLENSTNNCERVEAVMKRALAKAAGDGTITPSMDDFIAAHAMLLISAVSSYGLSNGLSVDEARAKIDNTADIIKRGVAALYESDMGRRIIEIGERKGWNKREPKERPPYIDATGKCPDFSEVPAGRKVQVMQRDGEELSPLAPNIAEMLPWAHTEAKAGHEIIGFRVVEN